MKSKLFTVLGVMAMVALHGSANPIGADRLLGTIKPGTPADVGDEMIMVNGLLDGWASVGGYNDGALPGTVMGDNPSDKKTEVYTLRYSASTLIPVGASLATLPGLRPTSTNPNIDLGVTSYEWLVAKWGQDSAVYYIGGLTGAFTLTLDGTGWSSQGHGLSHYTLFNPVTVPDGGSTVIILGIGLTGIAFFRRHLSL